MSDREHTETATAEQETPPLDRDLGLEGKPPPSDERPLQADLPPPSARVHPVVVPRWIQLVALPLAVLALWALARAAGTVLLVFVVSGVIALILNPLVRFLQQRAHFPRGLAVLAVYVGFFIAIGGGIALLVNPVSNQVESFRKDVPNLVDSANASLADVQTWLDDQGIDVEIKRQGETALETLQRRVQKRSGDLVSFTRDLLTKLVEAAFALILILVISIYMLLYGDQIGRLVRSVMPPGDGTPEDDYPLRVQKAVSGYVRGQAAFSLIMGLSAGVALWVFGAIGVFPDGRRYALFFGIFYGLMEAVPYVGPILGALPAVLVALFDDPLTAVWVIALFVGLQQLEGHVVAPQVFGHSLRINPLLVIFALLVGAELYGIVGALVALPLAAVARETAAYLRRHLVLEPWGTPGSLAVAGGGNADPTPERPCPECGTRQPVGDAYCRSCGAGLRRDADPPG